MSEAYIVSAVRTPIGKFGGALKDLSPADLGAEAMKGALARAGVDGDALDLYIFGNILRTGHGQLIPRQAAIKAGIPASVDGYAVDMVCSSGMMTVMNAAMAIKSGEADLVLTGGTESMSQAAFALPHQARWGYKLVFGSAPMYDTLTHDGLTDPLVERGMGDETEQLSEEYELTRDELDTVAFESHKRATAATAAGKFKNEIVPIEIKSRRGSVVVDADEGIRGDTTMDSLGGLRPAFKKDGILTAGNSSQISDGAAAMVIASEKAVKEHGLTPIGRIVGGSWAAGESWRFVEAPVPAVRKLTEKIGVSVDDFDLVENNEAFATNSVLFNKVLEIPYDKLNIWGGAIALGHPIGCSGARIIVTLLSALGDTGGKLGLASLCHGTGGGTAVAIERL